MPLFKLRLSADALRSGRAAADALGELAVPSPLAVTLFEHPRIGFLVEVYYGAEPAMVVLTKSLQHIGGLGPASLEVVPDQNWVALSQAALPPVAAGRFFVHGSHDRHRVGCRGTALEIEAGEAFGTGHNATTALCLEALDRIARTRVHRPMRVLDLGCGSGVLAIAAARVLPHARVLAVDNDLLATAVARANARLNGVGGQVQVLDAAAFAHPALRGPGSFDLVLANILPGPLLALAPAMRRALCPGGVAVLSGLLDVQTREVRARYLAGGFRMLGWQSRDGWSALTLLRNPYAPKK